MSPHRTAMWMRPQSEPHLRRWNNRVSSARPIYGAVVVRSGYALSGIILFSEPFVRGRSTEVTKVQSSLVGIPAHVRGLRLRAGTWEVCELASFNGRCALAGGDISELRSMGLDDHIGSLRLHVNLRRE